MSPVVFGTIEQREKAEKASLFLSLSFSLFCSSRFLISLFSV